MAPPPLVTVAIACRDDEPHIETCIRSVQAQDWPRDNLEILVADGMSMDATREILARVAAEDPRIVLVDNPARVRAAGLNECIRRARGDVIVRVEVRADYAPDFVSKCVEALGRTGADNVGGTARLRARTFFQRCVAAALESPLGIGGPPYHDATSEGTVENVSPGAFRRDVFERVGAFDPHAITNEDVELNQRIVDAGGRVHMSPDIVVHYYPRESMRALAHQYFGFGQARARMLLKHRRLRSWGSAMPLVWLVSEALLFGASPWHRVGLWSLATYALAAGAEAVRVGRSEGVLAIPVVWSIFPVLHVSHGAGFAAGLVRYGLKPDWAPSERVTQPGEAVESVAAGLRDRATP
ncbi:MAG: glycosyltransferase family 2 protein [Myxococcota bacterium]|nr:glycosyltransferase family 2 protein [Myxococcota bacterium]